MESARIGGRINWSRWIQFDDVVKSSDELRAHRLQTSRESWLVVPVLSGRSRGVELSEQDGPRHGTLSGSLGHAPHGFACRCGQDGAGDSWDAGLVVGGALPCVDGATILTE